MNDKYRITEIAHPEYPFLHRIQALQDIGEAVKQGELGGYVEHEGNLSCELMDSAWIFGDAICCNGAYVDKGAVLKDHAIACDRAYVSQFAVMRDNTRAEDDSYLRGGVMREEARISGFALVRKSGSTLKAPVLQGQCAVYGTVDGDVLISGNTVIHNAEKFINDSRDRLVLHNNERSVVREPERDKLHAQEPKSRKKNEPER